MKKSIISSLIASTLLLFGSIAPTIAKADTDTTGEINSTRQGIVTTNQVSYLFALNDNILSLVTNRGLAANTPWYYDKSVTSSDGQTYYRVATNEWLGSGYIGNVTVTNIIDNSNNNTNTTDPVTPTPTPDGYINTADTNRIVGNSDSLKYHVPGQRNFKIKLSNVVYFNTENDAINAGYSKSKV